MASGGLGKENLKLGSSTTAGTTCIFSKNFSLLCTREALLALKRNLSMNDCTWSLCAC